MRRRIDESVVVIVGATSGLGYATAQAFADLGARTVLAGRDEDRLKQAVADCEHRGATAIGVTIDVGLPDDVDRLLDRTVGAFGRVDTWVNCAAGVIAGPIDQTPMDELDRLIDTNVRGTVAASRAALGRFERQGHGVLINVASLLAVVPNPQLPAYAMSKYAIHGLTLSLHHRTRRHPAIHVCSVLPQAIDTPIYQRAANHTGRALRAIPPAVSPHRAAATIVSCARRPRRRMAVGWTARMTLVASRAAPATTDWMVANASAALLTRRHPARDTPGGLSEWPGDAATSAGWRVGRLRRSFGDAIGRARAHRKGASEYRIRQRLPRDGDR